MPIHHSPQPNPYRHRTRTAAIVLAWCAALAGAGLYLAAGDEPAVLPTTVTSSLPDDTSADASVPAASTPVGGQPANDAPADDAADVPADDAVDPDQPQPDPQPDPDPQPQVPLGADDLAPMPEPPPPTCDGECVAPVDLHPIEQEPGNPAAPLPVAGNDTAGCSVRCITRAQAFTFALDSTDVDIEVVTHTPAKIEVFVNDQAPQVNDAGRPFFPGVRASDRTVGDLDTYFSTTLTGLDEETEYWVIVRATDAQGRSESVTGSVVTKHLNDDIEVIFAAIDITYDGDKGRNKGELDFRWGIGFTEVGRNGEYKRDDGSRIDLSDQQNSYGRFDLGDGALPKMWVTGLEHDPGTLEFCSHGDEPSGYGTDNACGYAWNTTLWTEFTIADVATMADCSAFDLGDEFDGYQCTRISTNQSHSGIPEFSVVVAFKVF